MYIPFIYANYADKKQQNISTDELYSVHCVHNANFGQFKAKQLL